jgi:hypothetical protein
MAQWNLSWISDFQGNDSTFIVLMGDEPIFHHHFHFTLNERGKFAIDKSEFSFEEFNEFICELEQGESTEFYFDDFYWCDNLEYCSDSNKFTFCWMEESKFTIQLNENMRFQFAKVFRDFLAHMMELSNKLTMPHVD